MPAASPPFWLHVLAWVSLATAFACAVAIAVDILVRRYRQPMRIMEVVWPVTALYLGPLAVWGYQRYGRPKSARWLEEHARRNPPDRPAWTGTALGVSHCGTGCTLGDIVAELAVFGLGLTVAGTALFAEMIGDYLAALALGIAFQYFAIAPMRGLGARKGLVEAAKADVASLTSFEIGLFGWMALMYYVLSRGSGWWSASPPHGRRTSGSSSAGSRSRCERRPPFGTAAADGPLTRRVQRGAGPLGPGGRGR